MIKHEVYWPVGSPFHPAISLVPVLKRRVNDEFVIPIVKAFFRDLGIRDFNVMDIDKLKTEIEFEDIEHTEDFVQSYVYQEIFDDIHKILMNNKVQHPPKCILTFDKTLTPEISKVSYPGKSEKIRWGAIRLGDAPILYYIWIDLQDMIDFIKYIQKNVNIEAFVQDTSKKDLSVNRDFNNAISQALVQLYESPEEPQVHLQIQHLKQLRSNYDILQGRRGALNINLTWYTTDDLDLHLKHIKTGKEISYQKKEVPFENSAGILDIDANAGTPFTSNPQENIYFEPFAPEGEYELCLDFYKYRDQLEVAYTIKIIAKDASSAVFAGKINRLERNKIIAKFYYTPDQGVQILQ